MVSVLNQLLKKLKVDDFSKLTEAEKNTYREWEQILEGRKISDKDVATFFIDEISKTQDRLVKVDTGTREDLFLKVKLEFLKTILTFLDGPRREKIALEEQLKNSLK